MQFCIIITSDYFWCKGKNIGGKIKDKKKNMESFKVVIKSIFNLYMWGNKIFYLRNVDNINYKWIYCGLLKVL